MRKPEPFDIPVRKRETARKTEVPQGFSESADDAVRAAEQIKQIAEHINRSVEQARATHQRIMGIEVSGNQRLDEIKATSASLLKEMEDLRADVMTHGIQNMDTEVLASRQKEITQNLSALAEDAEGASLPSAREPEVKTAFQQHLESVEKLELDEPLELVPEEEPSAPDVAEPQTSEAAAAPEEIQPEPVAPQPAETEPASVAEAPAARQTESYDRSAAWQEMRAKLKSIDRVREDVFKTKDQLNEVSREIKRLTASLESADTQFGSIDGLVDAIADAQAMIGGRESAAAAREKLQALITVYQEGGGDLPTNLIREIKSISGTEGLSRQIQEARQRAAKAGILQKASQLLQSVLGYTEVSGLEFVQAHAKKQLTDAVDTLMQRLRNEHQLAYLNDRKKELELEKESQLQQIAFDVRLEALMADAIAAEQGAAMAKKRLDAFLKNLPGEAAAALQEYPHAAPTEIHYLMSAQDRQTYERLAAQYHAHMEKFDAALDEMAGMSKDGVAAFQARQSPQETTTTQPQATDTPRQAEEESLNTALEKKKDQIDQAWDADTRQRLTEMLKHHYPEYISDEDAENDVAEFIAIHLPDEAQRKMYELGRLQRELRDAETEEEMNQLLVDKAGLLRDIEEALRNPDLLRNPDIQGVKNFFNKRPGETTKADTGEKTLSIEELEDVSGAETVAPSYAEPIEGYLPPSEKEIQDKREDASKDLKELSAIFHQRLGDMSHSKLLPQAGTWNKLRDLDATAADLKRIDMLSADSKKELLKTLIELHNSLNDRPFDPYGSSAAEYLEIKSGGAEIKAIADTLGVNLKQLVREMSKPAEAKAEPAKAAPRRKPRQAPPPKPIRRRPATARPRAA